ncbi:MAG: glycoside hydrolase family 3 protein [Faecousia sp.]
MDKLYGTLSSEPTELELRNRALARQTAAEGFVLLKNENGALPLQNRKIALYGMGARKTVKGGLGSGSVEERYSVNIEDGLKNAGYEITSQDWLNDYDAEYASTYQAYHDMVEEKVKGLRDPMQIIPLAHSFVYRYPSGRLVTAEDVAKSDTDTAIYVLMRQAGEGNDRKLEKGDYYITDIERENLKVLGSSYAHTILVVNVGGHMDMEFLDEIPGIDAVVLFVQGGEEGGNALADVLSGKVNFSGKLADTIPMRYEGIPFGDEFSYLNGDVRNEYYKEGIYVGYRYFDSFRKEVRYPFGFGLSYTNFSVETKSVTLNQTSVTARVEVRNTGAVSGKEVVQLYVSVPGGKKEYQRLVTFEKTKILEPGASETLELTFDLTQCASYCEDQAAWVLDKGAYLVRIGNSSRTTSVAAVIDLPRSVVTCQCRTCCAPVDELPEFAPETVSMDMPESVLRLTATPADFATEVVDYAEPGFTETEQEKAILDGLTVEEQAWFLQGGDLRNPPKGAFEIHGAAGKTVTALLDKGIRNVIFSDGPAGVNIGNKVKALPMGGFAPAAVPERYSWGVMGAAMKAQLDKIPGQIVYRYATAWPVEMLLAQTWNRKLLRAMGEAVGEEMLAFGITIWLAPGMNIHRNPLGGRAFEYYSEDPVLTGEMAAALTSGVQSHKGLGVSVKHFCCNNSEDNRNGISANVSERALREIYLKGFEIAVRKSQPKTVMSSYNMVNQVYTANRHDLLTDILRCEWGFEGLVMTDWGSTNDHAGCPELAAPAGNDLIMPGSDYDRECVLNAIAEGKLSSETVRRSACRVLRMMLAAATPVRIGESK